MGADGIAKTWGDPYTLVREVTSYQDTSQAVTPAGAVLEDAIRQAHHLISPDLYVIERLKQSHVEPDYLNLFGDQLQEKLAALIYLTKHKLLDIEQSTLESRDVNDAKRDLTNYVEIIFNLRAVDALMIFYDFAEAQHDSRVPWLWRNVCSRCLYLMSLLTECRDKVVDFLKDRPEASKLMKELRQTTKPEIAQSLHGLARDYTSSLRAAAGPSPESASSMSAPMAAPLYVSLVQQYEERVPTSAGRDSAARGVSSLLSAQDRISQAAAAGDTASLLDWISNGSPAAMHTAFRCALSAMTPVQYIAMLEQSITRGNLDPVRLAAVVLELGSLGRSMHPQGGEPAINRLLVQITASNDPEFCGVAKVAVHELGTVRAFSNIRTVLEKAPLLEVAEEGVRVMRDLRNLPMVESLLSQRQELTTTYRQARRDLLELQDLVDAVWSCQSEELAVIYLEQLKQVKAFPELRQLALAPNFIAGIAKNVLVDIQNDDPWMQRA